MEPDTYTFSGSILLTTIVVMAVITAPVKFAADLANAKNSSFASAALAVLVGIVFTVVGVNLVGDKLGGFLAGVIGFALAIRLVMKTSLVGAVGVLIVAVGLSMAAVAVLVSLGVVSQC